MYAVPGPPPHRGLWPGLVGLLRHRGPDGGAWWADGPFFLGHRRLAIVGLSTGRQPMATADGDLVTTFNGEIYNYPELRRELEAHGCRFRTDSDTEVLLHGYRLWGEGLPARLTGMFAFALADRRRRSLFLARDRFGEKPLFLARTGRYLAFASELRPLAALPDLPQRLNPEALAGYLLLNYVPGTRCLLDGVERLRPGTWRLLTPQGERGGEYWSPPQAAEVAAPRPLPELLDECQARLDEAVRLNLRADVPVGIFLSGGMDSSLLAESAARQGRLNRAYCLDFVESSHSEYPAARLVADRLGLELERVTLSADALTAFPDLVEHADDPLADSSALAVWTLARQAARGNKVVLGGDGGDELFGGYLTYRATRLHARYVSALPRLLRRGLAWAGRALPTGEGKVSFSFKLRRFLRALHLPAGQAHFSWNGTWLPAEAAALLRPGPARDAALAALPALAAGHGLGGRPGLFELQRADVCEYLPNDILTKTDRMSMAHGLEIRAPYLEHAFASWALRLPAAAKLGRGELKVVLRALARCTFGPAIADRPKQGFSIPVHQWLRGPSAAAVHDLLTPRAVERLEVFEPDRVGAVVADHFSGRRSYGFELWGLAVLVAWHRARVQRRPTLPLDAGLEQLDFGQPGASAA
jgi:asparagine synthase (glutamine-hydrolysing)